MKYSGLICALVSAEPHLRQSRQAPDTERRYNQLTDMMEHYNPDFDERKYWTYGCNCLILGDRPMSDPGHGPPAKGHNLLNRNLAEVKVGWHIPFVDLIFGDPHLQSPILYKIY